ncbi:MAG: ROK family transcriptional regulator, partial [Fibrobacterota bacterium]
SFFSMESKAEFTRTQVIEAFILEKSITAPDLVTKTGLSRPTVDSILNEFIASGFIKKSGTGESRGGRRPVIFTINGTGRFSIGVAVAIPKIAGVIVDLNGDIHAEETLSLPIWTQADIFLDETAGLIRRLVDKLPQGQPFDGIGLAIPGLVDPEKGISIFFSRLSNFFNNPVSALLEKEIGRKVVLSRYLGSAAYSQILPFGEKYNKPLVYIELGEGIEMALFTEGRSYRGNIQNEGGLGHMVIEYNGRTCLCGAKGCLEAYASNRVLIDEAKLRVRNGEPSRVPTDRDMGDAEFYGLVRQNDPVALSVAETGMDYLAQGVANVVNLLNPARVIISGAITHAGTVFMERVKDRILYYALNVLGKELDIRFIPFDIKEGARGVGLLRLYQEQNVFV